MKWLFGALGTVVILILVAISIPFLIDFNKFKPLIQSAVEKQVHAKIDFESARLTVLGGLGVQLQKVKIENTDPDFKGTKLFSVDKVVLYTELVPLLKKKLVGRLVIDKPEIVIVTHGLKNNLTALAKPSDAPAAQTEKPKAADPAQEKELLERLKKDVVIKEVRISEASILLEELMSKGRKAPVKVTDLNLRIQNIGIDRDIKTVFSTKLDVEKDGNKVRGPLDFEIITKVKLAGKELDVADFKGEFDLNDLELNVQGAFVKAAKIPLNLKLAGQFRPNSLVLNEFNFNFHTLTLAVLAKINDFKLLGSDIKVSLRNKELARLGEVLPQHKAMLMNGSLALEASVQGPLSTPEKVKAKLDLDAVLSGSDLEVKAATNGLQPIQASLLVKSNRFDLGGLLKPFMKKNGAPPSESTAPEAATKNAKASNEPPPMGLNAQQRKMLEGAKVNIDIGFKEFLFDKIKVTDFAFQAKQENFLTTIQKFALNVFQISVNVAANANLGLTPPLLKAVVDVKSPRIDVAALQRDLGGGESKAPSPAPEKETINPQSETASSKSSSGEMGIPPELKKILQGLDIQVQVAVPEILYNKLRVDGFVLAIQQLGLVTHLKKLALKSMDIALDANVTANLANSPPSVKGAVAIKGGKLDVNHILKELGISTAPADAAKATPTPGVDPNAPPAKDLELTQDQKKLLQGIEFAFQVSLAQILYEKLKIDNFALKARQQALKASVDNFGMNIFGGGLAFSGGVDLGAAPIGFKGNVALQKIRVEQLIEFVKPEHKGLLQGAANIDLVVDGKGTTGPTISKTLNAKGTFAFLDGEIHTGSIMGVIQGKFDEFVQGLSVAAIAESSFREAEKILSNPALEKFGIKNQFDVSKYKGEYEKVKTVRLGSKGTVDKSLKDTKGGLEIKEGRIFITSRRMTPQGELNLNSSVGLDMSLKGGGTFNASPQSKQSMAAQSKHSNLLYDEKGNLDLKLLLGGSVKEPGVNVDFSGIKERFTRNAKASVDKEVKGGAQSLADKALKGKADAALAELRKKEAEAKAKVQGELKKQESEARAKLDAEKQKIEAEKKKQESAAKEKAKGEATKVINKDKLKGLFGK